METSEDKLWASRYLLDPLTAPEPSQETGPGTHHNATSSISSKPQSSSSSAQSQNTTAHARRSSSENRTSSTPPPAYTSLRQNRRLHRREHLPSSAVGSATPRHDTGQASTVTPATTGGQSCSNRQSIDRASTAIPTSTTGHSSRFSVLDSDQLFSPRSSTEVGSTANPSSTTDRPRRSFLLSRSEGDQSHRPLEIIRRDTKLANRAPHLRRKHHVGSDTIDSLDSVGGGYHHEGPFDATLLARNTAFASSPIAAVQDTNSETLKATPQEMVYDSIRTHRPLDGVAMFPPGVPGRDGKTYQYEETNLMVENGGDYKRWPGVNYLPTDLKGKGEPSYSLEKALKEKKPNFASHRRVISEGAPAIELTSPRPRSASSSGFESHPPSQSQRYSEWEGNLRPNSTGRSRGGFLRRGIGSLRKRHGNSE